MGQLGTKLIAENRKARFDYTIDDSIECGVVLQGTEVKSVKDGKISFPDSFAEIIKDEVWLKNFHISEYVYSSIFNHNPDRPKKLLLHREQIKRLQRKVEEKGYTLIPLSFNFFIISLVYSVVVPLDGFNVSSMSQKTISYLFMVSPCLSIYIIT